MLRDEVAKGRLKGLSALRDRLAADIDECASMRDLAALSQRLMDVLAQIEALDPPVVEQKVSGLSEFEKRLSERQQTAKGKGRAASR